MLKKTKLKFLIKKQEKLNNYISLLSNQKKELDTRVAQLRTELGVDTIINMEDPFLKLLEKSSLDKKSVSLYIHRINQGNQSLQEFYVRNHYYYSKKLEKVKDLINISVHDIYKVHSGSLGTIKAIINSWLEAGHSITNYDPKRITQYGNAWGKLMIFKWESKAENTKIKTKKMTLEDTIEEFCLIKHEYERLYWGLYYSKIKQIKDLIGRNIKHVFEDNAHVGQTTLNLLLDNWKKEGHKIKDNILIW